MTGPSPAGEAVRFVHRSKGVGIVIQLLIGVLVIAAIVLVVLKVAAVGGILAAIALVLLVLLLLGRL
jgi:hypothetical protein